MNVCKNKNKTIIVTICESKLKKKKVRIKPLIGNLNKF